MRLGDHGPRPRDAGFGPWPSSSTDGDAAGNVAVEPAVVAEVWDIAMAGATARPATPVLWALKRVLPRPEEPLGPVRVSAHDETGDQERDAPDDVRA